MSDKLDFTASRRRFREITGQGVYSKVPDDTMATIQLMIVEELVKLNETQSAILEKLNEQKTPKDIRPTK